MTNIDQLIHDLRCCAENNYTACKSCSRLTTSRKCTITLRKDAATALEQLRKENAKLREQMRWIIKQKGKWTSSFSCNVCGRCVVVPCIGDLAEMCVSVVYPYCNCGAKMDLEPEQEDARD